MLDARANWTGKPGGTGRPGDTALILMHFLGGSRREWDEVVTLLGDEYRTVALSLPGFGESNAERGYTVSEMADAVEAFIASLSANPGQGQLPSQPLGRFTLVGHSMSGKVAMVLARRHALDPKRLPGLAGLILVAPSPPGPEPMSEEKRTQMMANLGYPKEGDRERAKTYVSRNEERDLAPHVLERTINEVLKMDRAAWRAWLEHGSREDWSEYVGVLDLPALVVAAEKDGSLGPDPQRQYTLPHLANADFKTLARCSHLIPLERPIHLAELFRNFLSMLNEGSILPPVPADYLSFIASERVSARTREVLLERMHGPAPTGVLDALHMQTLRAVLNRVIPQEPGKAIDLAGFIAAKLASGKGDGWRYDNLPPDLEAYRIALETLARHGFLDMSPNDQDAVLKGWSEDRTSPQARWFEELRGDATTAWVAHPATLAAMGYSGIGVGGPETPNQGYVVMAPNDREAWEPVAVRMPPAPDRTPEHRPEHRPGRRPQPGHDDTFSDFKDELEAASAA